jgi:hypothetical protein
MTYIPVTGLFSPRAGLITVETGKRQLGSVFNLYFSSESLTSVLPPTRVPFYEGIGTAALASLPNPRFFLQSHSPTLPSHTLVTSEQHTYNAAVFSAGTQSTKLGRVKHVISRNSSRVERDMRISSSPVEPSFLLE